MYLVTITDSRTPDKYVHTACKLHDLVRALPVVMIMLIRQNDFESLTYTAGTKHFSVRKMPG